MQIINIMRKIYYSFNNIWALFYDFNLMKTKNEGEGTKKFLKAPARKSFFN